MATATVCSESVIVEEVKSTLSRIPGVLSIHTLLTEQQVFSVWVGIADDLPQARHSVYQFEDEIAARHGDVLFDFHVVPLAHGRKMQDFVSSAHVVFQRSIA
jgi:hypothetical protein